MPRRSEQLLIDHTLSELPGQQQRRWPRKHANMIGVFRRVSACHPGYRHDHHQDDHGYPAVELITPGWTRTRALIGAVFGP